MAKQVQAVDVYDTIDSCWYVMQWTQRYLEGKYPPHYPVPALVSDVNYPLYTIWDNTD